MYSIITESSGQRQYRGENGHRGKHEGVQRPYSRHPPPQEWTAGGEPRAAEMLSVIIPHDEAGQHEEEVDCQVTPGKAGDQPFRRCIRDQRTGMVKYDQPGSNAANAGQGAQLPLHVLLLQNWGFTAELAWNHPAWSISTELAAYLLFPLLSVCAMWDRRGTPALIVMLIAVLAALHLVFALSGESSLGAQITRLGLIRCLAEFAVGTMLCALWQRWRQLPAAPGRSKLAFLAALAFASLAGLAESAFIPALFAAGLLALALDRGIAVRILSSRPLHWLGEVSYSTYLAHFFLLVLFKIVFVDVSMQIGWGRFSLYLALVLAASAVLFHGLEKPAQRWINRRMPQGLARPGPAIG